MKKGDGSIKNNDLYEKTVSLIEHGKIKQALMLTRKLLKDNPNSTIIKMQYARLLTYDEKTKLRGIDMMMKIYNSTLRYASLIELGKQAKLYGDYDVARYFFEELVKTNKLASIYAILELINLDILENKFEEAYQLLKENYIRIMYIIDKGIINNIDFHIRFHLGLLQDDEEKKSYYKRNLICYDENDVISHIKRHISFSDKKKIHTQFDKNIDIIKIFTDVKEKINITTPIYSTSVDIYYINYGEHVGVVNNEPTTYLEVVTYINTKNILTIYPISKEKALNNQKIKKI